MIPKWQIVGGLILALIAAAAAIYSSPNSYAYAFLTGQCYRKVLPPACHPNWERGSVRGHVPGWR